MRISGLVATRGEAQAATAFPQTPSTFLHIHTIGLNSQIGQIHLTILQFGQIYLTKYTKKYLQFGQIHLSIRTNTFVNSDNYILHIPPKHPQPFYGIHRISTVLSRVFHK